MNEELTTKQTVRFWSQVQQAEVDECWFWLGPLSSKGYGRWRPYGKGMNAHRFSYQWAVGPIRQGLTIDHLCHNRDRTCKGGVTCTHRRCVNPKHLQPVSMAENVRRGGRARQAHCLHGHPLSGLNLVVRANGARVCRKCGYARTSEWQRLHAKSN